MQFNQKLDQLEKRFEELTRQMADPAVISDSDQYRKVTKAQSELSEVVAKYRQWKKAADSLAQARPMLEEKDPDLREMAQDEILHLEPELKQIEADLRDRFGKTGDEVKALLLITEIRIRAEQKGIVSVETESSRLKCLRNSGRRDDWVQVGTRFSRLTAPKPLLRLREIISFLNNLPNP